MEGMSNSHVEREAANLVVHAERLLATAQSMLQQHHLSECMPAQRSPDQQQQFFIPGGVANDVFANKPPLSHNAPDSPASSASVLSQGNPPNTLRSSHFTNARMSTSPPKRHEPLKFEDLVRARATELGIKRVPTNVSCLSSSVGHSGNRAATDASSRQVSKSCNTNDQLRNSLHLRSRQLPRSATVSPRARSQITIFHRSPCSSSAIIAGKDNQ